MTNIDDEKRIASAGTRAPTALALVLWDGGGATYFVRPGETLRIGRHRESEIVVGLPSVSRQHARLVGVEPSSGSLAIVEDAGGMEGVRVGGDRIPTNQSMPIGPGEVVELGGAVLLLYPARTASRPSGGPRVRVSALRPSSGDPAKPVERLIDLVAASELGVLVTGDPGVGKTSAAEAIHARSSRAKAVLARLDCAGVPQGLLDGILFGHEGDASNAGPGVAGKAGILEATSGGTLLLEDVGEMPLVTQRKLLTALDSGRVLRNGGSIARPFDVRLIATSKRDLGTRAGDEGFLPGLHCHIDALTLVVPPLRDRANEIPTLARRLVAEASMRLGRAAPRLSNEALGLIVHHPFKTNVKGLRDALSRACSAAQGNVIQPEHLDLEGGAPLPSAAARGSAMMATRRFRPLASTDASAPAVEEPPIRKPS